MASACGRRIVEMIWEDLKPRDILTRKSVENALVVHSALAGSTNAMVHLVAIARRAGVPINLKDFDEIASRVPVIVNLRPSGKWLMEEFHIAGGTRALLSRLKPMLHLDARTRRRRRMADAIGDAQVYDDDVIRPLNDPIAASGGTAILYGNLAPDGCVMKPPAAEPRLLQHTGPALVFDSYDEMNKAVDDLDLPVTPDHVMVLRNAGPIGGPGMPEWGMLPIPKKLLRQGVRDMLRISDARMSGTSYGACILHVAPEAQIGGPLAAVRTGDRISVDVPSARSTLTCSDAEIAERIKAYKPPPRNYPRGYYRLFAHIPAGERGLRFRLPGRPRRDPEPEFTDAAELHVSSARVLALMLFRGVIAARRTASAPHPLRVRLIPRRRRRCPTGFRAPPRRRTRWRSRSGSMRTLRAACAPGAAAEAAPSVQGWSFQRVAWGRLSVFFMSAP